MYGSSADPGVMLLLQSLALPLGLCLGMVSIWVWASRNSSWGERLLMSSIAVLIAFWAAFAWIEGRFGFPPGRALDVVPLFGVAGLALDQWQRLREGGERAVGVLAGLMLAGLLFWLLKPVVTRMETSVAMIQLALPVIGYLLCFGLLSHPSLKEEKAGLLMSMAAVAAPVIALGGTLKLGQMTGALAAALGAIWMLGLVFPRCRQGIGQGHTVLMLLVALYAAAHHYADVPAGALLLIPTVVLLAWVVRQVWPWPASWKDSLRTLALALLPLAGAVWWVWPQASLY